MPARQIIGRLLDIHIRRLGLPGVDDMDAVAFFDRARAALDLVSIEHEDQVAPAHTLVVAHDIHKPLACRVYVLRRDGLQLIPRKNDVVSVDEQIIVLPDACHIELFERLRLFPALLQGFKAAIPNRSVGALEQRPKLAVIFKSR